MHGKHAVSMTAQIYEGNIYCTRIGPNFFFARANRETGCIKLADTMSKTLKAYESDYYASYTAKMKK